MKYYVDKSLFPNSMVATKIGAELYKFDGDKWTRNHRLIMSELKMMPLTKILNGYRTSGYDSSKLYGQKLIQYLKNEFYKDVLSSDKKRKKK